MLKKFNVHVHRTSGSRYIGQVSEKSEELARCAALSRYGIADDNEISHAAPNGDAIFPEEEFDVSPA